MKKNKTKNRKKYASLFFLLMLACTGISAQQIEATVHYKDDRKRKLTLEDKAWNKQTEVVNFKNGKKVPLEKIHYLDINGVHYEPQNVQFNYLETKQGISTDKVVVVVDTTLLLKKIIGGKVSLYQYIDDQNKEHYFLEKEGQAVAELLNRKYKKGTKLYETGEYKGQLEKLLLDCEGVQKEDVQRLSFALYSLRKVIKAYNSECGHINYVVPKEPFRIHFGPIIGFAQHRSTFDESPGNSTGLGHFLQRIADDERINSFQFGGFVDIPLSRRTNAASLQLHAFYANRYQSKFENVWYNNLIQTDTSIYRADFDATYFEFGFSVERKFFLKKPAINFFVGAGLNIGNTINVSKNSATYIRARRPLAYKESSGFAISEGGLPKNVLIYQFRGGVNFKKIQLGAIFRMGEGGITGYVEEHRKVYGMDVRYRF